MLIIITLLFYWDSQFIHIVQIGPRDPRWFGGVGEPGFGFDPSRPEGVPPGARFDPYGPPGVPGFEPNRFARYVE